MLNIIQKHNSDLTPKLLVGSVFFVFVEKPKEVESDQYMEDIMFWMWNY